MKEVKNKSGGPKLLIFGSIYLLLGIAAVVYTPGNYFLYANLLVGLLFVFGYLYGKGE